MAYMAKLKDRGNERQWCRFRNISPASGVGRVCCVTRQCRIHESVRETGRREEDLEVACMVGTMPGLAQKGVQSLHKLYSPAFMFPAHCLQLPHFT
ncbi:unnamed protein product [Sphagnum compactum]